MVRLFRFPVMLLILTGLLSAVFADLNSGLVGYWKFDETSGSTAYDSSGNGHNAQLSGPIWTSGVAGNALDYNGNNDSATIPTSTDFNLSGNGKEISISAWIKTKGAVPEDAGQFIISRWEGLPGGAAEFCFYIQQNTKKLNFLIGPAPAAQYTSNCTIPNNTWLHVAVTHTFGNAGSTRMYINGVLVTGSWSGDGNKYFTNHINNPVTIGYNQAPQYPFWFNGQIDEVRLYSRALSSTEIYQLYNQNNPYSSLGDSLKSGLVGYWKFDETSGLTAYDSSGNGHNAQLSGPIWTSGIIGNALDYDGNNDSATIPTSTDFNLSGNGKEISISAWIRTEGAVPEDAGQFIISRWEGLPGGAAEFCFCIQQNTKKLNFLIGPAPAAQYTSNCTIPNNTWLHVAVTHTFGNAGSTRMYINGILVTGSWSGDGNKYFTNHINNPVTIGYNQNPQYPFWFNGQIDEIRVYGRALNSREISGLFIEKDSLIGKWDFSESSGDTAFDISGHNHHAKLYGPSWVTGIKDNGLNFDGIDDSSKVEDNSDFDFGTHDFTASIWFNKAAYSSGYNNSALFGNWRNAGNNPGNNEWVLVTTLFGNDDKPVFCIEDSASQTTYYSNCDNSVNLNTWYHLVGVRDGSVMRLYLNGVLQDTTILPSACNIRNTHHDLQLGFFGDGTPNAPKYLLNGMVDNARLYRRALKPAEIGSLYQMEHP